MYYILIKYFYYQNSLFSPSNGPLFDIDDAESESRKYHMIGRKDTYPDILKFSTIDEAKQYLSDQGVTWEQSNQTFKRYGLFYCCNGEYDRPQYQIRKVR